MGTWGGDYARLLRENIDAPILEPQGVQVVQVVADEAPRLAQLFAQRQLPRGTLDIACVGSPNGYRAAAAGLLETLDASKVPNLKNVVPLLHSGSFMPDQFVPHIYSAQGLAYNPTDGEGSAEDLDRPARSALEGQGRRASHRRILGDDGRGARRRAAARTLSTRRRSIC